MGGVTHDTEDDVIEQDFTEQDLTEEDATEEDATEKATRALPLPDEEPEPPGPSRDEEATRSTLEAPSVGGRARDRRRDSSDDSGSADGGEHPTDVSATSANKRVRSRVTRQQLEAEGDIAADYLEELLDIVDLDGDIDIDVENERAAISIIGEGVAHRSLKRLVGDGEVLEAMQELTRLAVQTKTGERSRLMLDIARFRAHRKEELEQVARAAITRQREHDTPVHLDPMTPFERKVVHDVVATAGLRSESEGDGDNRHVVITSAC